MLDATAALSRASLPFHRMLGRAITPSPSSALVASPQTPGNVASSSNPALPRTPQHLKPPPTTASKGDGESSEDDEVVTLLKFTPGRGRRRREFTLTSLPAVFKRRARYGEQALLTEGQNLGPVPVRVFLDELLPLLIRLSGDDARTARMRIDEGVTVGEAGWQKVPETRGEKEVYDVLKNLFLRLIPKDTHNVKLVDHTTGETFRPDFSALAEDIDDDLLRLLALAYAETFGDVKPEIEDLVGQLAHERGVLLDTEKRRHARGQFGTYSEICFLAGFRTAMFSFCVLLPDNARLILHDRGGTIFTEKFNFRKSGILEEFVTRLEGVSDAQRGRDTSVVFIAQGSYEAALALQILLEQDLPQGLEAADVLPVGPRSEKDDTVVYKDTAGCLFIMLVFDPIQSRFHRIVVHRTFYCDTAGLTGEGTRHFYGIELDERILVHVQEDWRITADGMIPETELYEIFGSRDVENLPEFWFGSDVLQNTYDLFERYGTRSVPRNFVHDPTFVETITNGFAKRHPKLRSKSNYCEQPDNAVEVLPRRLHRMVFRSIPLTLDKYASTQELAQVLRDAVECHEGAYQLGFLHRNIGGHSIFINATSRRGMLMQWTQALIWSHESHDQRTRGRCVCWEFLSAELLEDNARRAHILRDDLESFAHVLLYYAVRYRPVREGCEGFKGAIRGSLEQVFDQAHMSTSKDGASATGGSAKRAYLVTPPVISEHFSDAQMANVDISAGLTLILDNTRELFRALLTPAPLDKLRSNGRKYRDDLAKWQREHDAAVEQLSSSTALLAAFDSGLAATEEDGVDVPLWPLSDGAIDQYPHGDSSPVDPFQGTRTTQSESSAGGNRKRGSKRSHESVYPPGSGNVEAGSSGNKRPRK